MILDEMYYEELTGSTLKELRNVGRWFNDLYGNYPTVIGGWAVYLLNPRGYGSRDIDILFPERRMKERLVNQYLAANGFVPKMSSPFEQQYVKEVETSKGKEEIYIDACSLEDTNRVHGSDVVVPWSLAMRHSELVNLEGIHFYVPRPEVLIVLKAKAALDREYDRKRTFDPYYLDSKILKDYYDVVSLLKACVFDSKLLAEILGSTGFKRMFLDVLGRGAEKKEILKSHDMDKKILAELISGLGLG